jgi:2-methylcitrate dehydratase PrpD
MTTIVERLAAYAAASEAERLPSAVLHHAKRALLDWFAAVLPGAQLPPASLLSTALGDEVGHGRAAICGTPNRAPLRTAALINATAAHTIEFDDIFRDALYHPGCPVIGAALAAAQAHDADGKALLHAIVIGYEVSTRIGLAVQPSHYRYWHTTGTIGTFGAAAAVAAVLGLDAAGHANALANAATFAAGLQQAFRSEAMSKPLHAGHAAEAGALAALGAMRGITGALDVLEGPAGFGAAMSSAPDWSRSVDRLGTHFNITDMTFKNHGCCGHCFASIDGALALRNNICIDDIERINVGTYKTALDVTNRMSVASAFDGRFSTPFTVASALIHGSVRLNAFTDERLADQRVQRLMQRIYMSVDDDCEADFPGRRSARIEIATKDGKLFCHYQATRKGDPDAPLTDAELSDKFQELAGPILGEVGSAALLSTILRADELGAPDVLTLGLHPT